MKFYRAGYYLVKKQEPFNSWTTTEHVNQIYPNTSIFLEEENEEKSELQKALKISDIEFQNLRTLLEKDYISNRIDYPIFESSSYVFQNLNTAYEVKEKYFYNLEEVKIIGIYLPSEMINEYLRVNNKYEGGNSFNLNSIIVSKKIIEEDFGEDLGYDVIGDDDYSEYHSFLCYYFQKKCDVLLNDNNLITSYDEAKKMLKHTKDYAKEVQVGDWFIVKMKAF